MTSHFSQLSKSATYIIQSVGKAADNLKIIIVLLLLSRHKRYNFFSPVSSTQHPFKNNLQTEDNSVQTVEISVQFIQGNGTK